MFMKSKCLLVGWICCCVALLSSCGNDDPMPEPTIATRTVLVYFSADNNLSKFALEDLSEMKEGLKKVSDTNIHFLVYMDTGSSIRLIELQKKKGDVVEVVLKEYEDRNSTGIAETTEVFNEVFANKAYAAESYGLVYWSHCDGWIPYPVPSSRWIGQDMGNGDNRMNLSDFVQVLNGAPHFDFILFDACFMQSVEVAYELRNYTDYYIASPTETPGPGAPYDQVVPWMFVKGAAADMAQAYFNVYEAKYNGGSGISNSNWTGGCSICAVETGRLETLATMTNQALTQVDEEKVAGLRSSVFDYDQRSEYESHVGYYDLAEMMEALVDEATYAQWKQAFDATIAYWNTTEKNYSAALPGMFSMEGTNGVTHYIPASTASAAAEAYRSTKWYSAAGLSALGW